MAKFTYVVQDNEGIHARPAGMLAKAAAGFKSTITLDNGAKKALEGVKVTIAGNGKTADATRLMAIMAMGIKKGMEVEVTVEGENEEAAAAKMEEFFKANL